MLHQLMRYLPVVKNLKEGNYGPVCEVGSGTSGITKFYDKKVFGVDINFTDYTGSMQGCGPNIVPAIAGADMLPFKDESFDLVFSCDMMEHIPAKDRGRAVSEMLRVARKKVILVFPCGKLALVGDRALNGLCLKLGKNPPAWLTEHLATEFPTRGEIVRILERLGWPFKVRGNASLPAHYAVLALESIRRIRTLFSEASREPGFLTKAFFLLSDLGPTYRIVVEIDKKS